jgi:hypothetical protein
MKTALIEGVGWPIFEGLPERFKHDYVKPVRVLLSKSEKKRLNALSEGLINKDAEVLHPYKKEKKGKGSVEVSKHPLSKTFKELELFETRRSKRKNVHLNLKKKKGSE